MLIFCRLKMLHEFILDDLDTPTLINYLNLYDYEYTKYKHVN